MDGLTCCSCGGDAGRCRQWWNRDTGFGVCRGCIAWLRSEGVSEEELRANYGVEGVNFEAPPEGQSDNSDTNATVAA